MRLVWAIICGTIRDQVDFCLILDYLLRCRKKGIIQGIVVSTWKGEFDNLPDLEMKLALNNVDVVMSETIDKTVQNIRSGSVNYWRQAKQMQAVLDIVPADAIILKTRTDRALPATRRLVAMLDEADPLPTVAEQRQQRNLMGLPQVFDHQIAIFKARTGRILQFTDFAFLGYSHDVRKLINFDVADFYFTRGLVANIQFFIYPFIRDYPIIRDYYRVIGFQPLLADLKQYTENGGTKFPKFFERVYAVYFGLLATHFRIGSLTGPNWLGEVTTPIEFADLFHSGNNHNLFYDTLGVTLNTQAVLDEFLSQPIVGVANEAKTGWHPFKKRQPIVATSMVQDESTKQVLGILKDITPATLERITQPELTELKEFSQNKEFSEHRWLNIARDELTEQKSDYKVSVHYDLPGITDEEREQIWKECEETGGASRILFEFWLAHGIKPEDSAPYLMSSARTDNRFSILTATRLLRSNRFPQTDVNEILRINSFFGGFHVRHQQMNAEIACYVLALYMYFVEHDIELNRHVTRQTKYAFERFFPTGFEKFSANIHDTAALEKIFDAELDRLDGIKARATYQRVTEMALEVTHMDKYWQSLKAQFNGRFKVYENTYHYAVKNDLI